MKIYTYKMQWLFSTTGNLGTPTTTLRRELYTIIRILGARSLSEIVFRDEDLNVVHSYSSMVMHANKEADKQAIQYIRKYLKANLNIHSVELLRR